MIPPDASVSTQMDIGSHLSHRFDLNFYYHPGAEYILIDRTTIWHRYDPTLLKNLDKYTCIYTNNGVEIYRLTSEQS
jgi:hypothetical protein